MLSHWVLKISFQYLGLLAHEKNRAPCI